MATFSIWHWLILLFLFFGIPATAIWLQSRTSRKSTPITTPVVASLASFRDPTKLTTWLKYFLYASIAIDAIALFSNVLQFQLLSDFELGVYSSDVLATAVAESNDKRQQIIGIFGSGIAITTMVIFAMWIYRANFNVRQLGAQGMKFSPGWSVGYYFIPVLCFWKPYQAMKEIWQASNTPASWESVERGAILPWWWFFFLISNVLYQVSFRLSLRAEEISEHLTSTGLTAVADAVSIPATIVALVLVKEIHEMQMSHVR